MATVKVIAAIARSISTEDRSRFRVWHAQNIPSAMTLYAVTGVEEAKALIDRLILEDLEDESIKSNAFGLEELETDGYHEWQNEMGQDIAEIMDDEEA